MWLWPIFSPNIYLEKKSGTHKYIRQTREVLDRKIKNQIDWEWNGMLTCAIHKLIGGLDPD